MAAVPAQGTTQPPRPTSLTATARRTTQDSVAPFRRCLSRPVGPGRPDRHAAACRRGLQVQHAAHYPVCVAQSGTPTHGTLSPASSLPAGVNTATFSVTYSAVDNGVQILPSPNRRTRPGKPGDPPGPTAPFDVLKELTTFAGNDPRLTTGLGVGNNGCTAGLAPSRPALPSCLEHGSVVRRRPLPRRVYGHRRPGPRLSDRQPDRAGDCRPWQPVHAARIRPSQARPC